VCIFILFYINPNSSHPAILFSLLLYLSLPLSRPSLEPRGFRNYKVKARQSIVSILQDPLLWSGPASLTDDEMHKLPVAVQALHQFWVGNHPWPRNPSQEWKTERNNTLQAVDTIISSYDGPARHPFCCDALNEWIRDLITKVAYYPGFPVVKACSRNPEQERIRRLPIGHTHEDIDRSFSRIKFSI
jgi:hypothetical protein